jgi:hypothetical protein
MGYLESNGDQDRGCDVVRRRTRLGRGGAGGTGLPLLNATTVAADDTVRGALPAWCPGLVRLQGHTPLRVIRETGRQMTRRRPSIRWSTRTAWFQLANVWLNSSSVCSLGLSVFLTRVAPYLLPHARPHFPVSTMSGSRESSELVERWTGMWRQLIRLPPRTSPC